MSTEALREIAPEPVASAHLQTGVGDLAARGNLRLIQGELQIPGFLPEEIQIVGLISEGQTTNQIARRLDCPPDAATEAETKAMEKLGTHSKSVLVDRCIRLGVIPIEVKPDSEILAHITPLDRRMINLYARGVSNYRIAKEGHIDRRMVEAYHDGLLEKLGAWSRPQAIRRSYELRLRKIKPWAPRASTYQTPQAK